MLITGHTKRIDRVVVSPPTDGVHVIGKDGKIKGTHSIWIGDKLIPCGMVGFYWRNGDIGYKIYYSIKHGFVTPKKTVLKSFYKMQRLYKKGLCPKPYKVGHADLILDGKKINAWLIKMDHVHYPESIWERFAQGYPYDWNVLNATEHPEHSPEGYNKFVDRLGRRMKIGDVVYCTKQKRWYVVDVDEL